MIELSDQFKNSIESSNYTLYPFVIIGAERIKSTNPINYIEGEDVLFISTGVEAIPYDKLTLNEESVDSLDYKSLFYEDYNLKITSFKDSIDIKNHSVKTSNVTVRLSTSNKITNSNAIQEGKSVWIYWKTQECVDVIRDSLLVYNGTIKRITQNKNSITLTVEDKADSYIHNDVSLSI